MTDEHDWERDNARYLSAAFAWLRLRLERCAAEARPAEAPAAPPPAEPARLRRRPRPSLPAAPSAPTGKPADVDAARAAMDEAAAVTPPPALVALAETLHLSGFERDLLLLCAAYELDPAVPGLCAEVQGGLVHPTFGLALNAFDEPHWDAVSPQRGLRYWRLIEPHPSNGLIAAALRIDERILHHIKGLTYLDERLQAAVVPVLPDPWTAFLPGSQLDAANRVVDRWRSGETSGPPLVQLIGASRATRQLVAGHAAATLGLLLHRLPVTAPAVSGPDADLLARLWRRESLLLPVALYVDAGDEAADAHATARFLARLEGCVVCLSAGTPAADLDQPAATVEIPAPTAAEQHDAWAHALGPAEPETADLLAGHFLLDTAEINELVLAYGADRDALWRGCLIASRHGLDGLAERLDPRAGWDDLVLPADEMRLLRRIADQVGRRRQVYDTWGFARQTDRGLGISALFAGPSGTGKTFAAEVLAHELGLNLYRIDLSAVVNKYIGETEKNLRRLFDAAEGGGSILFFDEADALFGKRSEVTDAHDRYANVETGYLLQRMEAYRGLAVLSTNSRASLDSAFERRLRFVVTFRQPEVAERRALWQRAFPAAAEVEPLPLDRLAALPMTGGVIRNVAVNAAFAAAADGGPITVGHVLDATRVEFRKLDLPVHERDFAWAVSA